MTPQELCTNLILGAVFICFFVLIIFAIKVHSIDAIVSHPGNFLVEIILIGFIPALLIGLVLLKTRKLDRQKFIITTVSLALKFMIFHLLFQLSGVYEYTFPQASASNSS